MGDFRSDVHEAVARILGTLDENQERLLYSIVEAVCIYVDQSLRKGVSNIDCSSVYVVACTLYSLSLFRSVGSEGLSDFTAGTLSVSLRQDHSPLTQMADQLMASWLAPNVVFRGVRG